MQQFRYNKKSWWCILEKVFDGEIKLKGKLWESHLPEGIMKQHFKTCLALYISALDLVLKVLSFKKNLDKLWKIKEQTWNGQWLAT